MQRDLQKSNRGWKHIHVHCYNVNNILATNLPQFISSDITKKTADEQYLVLSSNFQDKLTG